jgi:membrane protein
MPSQERATKLVLVLRRFKGWWAAYTRKDFTNRSASLSFYTIISIVPLVLVLTTVLGHVVPQQVLVREMMQMIEQFFPIQNPAVLENLKSLFVKRRTFGWFGVVTLLLSSRLLYLNLEHIVNDLLQTGRKRNYLLRRLFILVWLAGSMLVLLTPLLLGAVRQTLSVFELDLPPALATRSAFLVSAFLMFFCAALILPTRRVPVRRMLAGGAYFAGALIAGQMAFKTLTARSVAQYNLLYGSLASLMLGALWIFYFYQMFLMLIYWTGRNHAAASTAESQIIRADYAGIRAKKRN